MNCRLLFFLASLFLMMASCKQSSINVDKERAEIHAVLMAQQDAWNEADIDGFMEGYRKSENLSFIGKNGIVKGWNQTLANYKKNYPDKATMGRLRFDIISTDILAENAARVVGKYTLYRENDEPSGYFTLFWRKYNGEWKIVADHTSG